MLRTLALIALLLPGRAFAEPDHQAIAERTLAVLKVESTRFKDRTEDLRGAECGPDKGDHVHARFNAAWDAWMHLHPLRFGPLEEEDRALQIAFWPDSRGTTGRRVARLLKAQDPVVDDPSAFAKVSVAARGFYALERLLYDDEGPIALSDPYRCQYITAVTADLHRLAEETADAWAQDWGTRLIRAGAPENDTFLAAEEVSLRLFASLTGALDETLKTRLAAPLGSFDRPKPRIAEARRSNRSLDQIVLNVEAVGSIALATFGPEMSEGAKAQISRALEGVREASAEIRSLGSLPKVITENRLKVEILAQRVAFLAETLRATVGPELGIAEGFNSADGD